MMCERATSHFAPMGRIERAALRSVLWFNRKAKRAAIRIVSLTRGQALHPKHLVGAASAWWGPFCGGRVLDVGCGTGAASRFMPFATFLVGLDRDADALNIAHGRVWRQRLNRLSADPLPVVRADLRDGLPFRDRSFETVLCHDCLEHLDDRPMLLREIRRVLVRGGRLVLGVPNGHTRWRKRLRLAGVDSRSDPDHRIEYTEAVLRRELADGGFQITRRIPGILDTPWTGVFDRWRQRRAQQHPGDDAAFYVVCR